MIPTERQKGFLQNDKMTKKMDANIKRILVQTVNAFETSDANGNYALLTVFRDGKGGTRQITYGRSQTTEQGNLKDLLQMYVDNKGTYADKIAPFLKRIGRESLVDNAAFKRLLVVSAKVDPVMRQTQDQFFDKQYFQRAMKWAADNGIVLPLSLLVIYDSFVHSGSIMWFLRKRFAEKPPTEGGDEKAWIGQYLAVRLAWLSTHWSAPLRRSAYRVQTLLTEIKSNNWHLDKSFVANDEKISPDDKGALV